jgi:CheY-like chemotaxis protein
MDGAIESVPTTLGAAALARVTEGDRGRLVLVIDDDQAVREMMQRHLTSHGFSVVTAENGYEGLALARKLKPAVITLDAIMPGLDGWSVLGALKAGEETSSIPVVIVTVMDKAEHSHSLGATEFLPKPIDWDRLIETLARYTGNKRDRSVLVVDDDENVREVLRRNLEADGWSVLEAQNGSEALQTLSATRPAAVVLDLMMPVMDGFEFILRYSQVAEWLSIPVLVLTAKDPTPDEQRHLQGQVARVLRKGNYSEEELLAEIHRRVDSHLRSPLLSGNGANDGKNPGG